MRHLILVKWNDQVADKAALAPEIDRLFDGAREIPGVESVEVHTRCNDRPNRYDLMIEMTMNPASLPAFDASETHRLWKEQYSLRMEAKAIFDCD